MSHFHELARSMGVPRQTLRRWIDGKSSPDQTVKGWIVDHKLDLMRIQQKPGQSFTLQEIADFTGLTRERIRQIEHEALKKIRKKIHAITTEIRNTK
jgi:DNA-binding XRE family transcriptional regulator